MKKNFTKQRVLLKKLTFFTFLLFYCSTVFSQSQIISGTVSDSSGPLPGVSVMLLGSTAVGTTDNKGQYTLNSSKQLSNADSIIFSYIGYAEKKVAFDGRNIMNVLLVEDTQVLKEVVVTALDIKRDKRSLGSATQMITSEQLSDAQSNNWVSALSGKVAGLNLLSTGSGPVNSVKVILRGNNSLNPDSNYALIVLDGVPVSSGMTSSGVSNAYGAGSGNDVPIDFGNGISDINPNDIASVTVLKGASATALYGNRAANGALIITTKSGTRKDNGIGVTINSNVSFNDVLKWPDFQYQYGQGTGTTQLPASQLYYSYGNSADGIGNSGTSSAYGPAFNGQSYFQYDPVTQAAGTERTPWVAYKDNVKGFFRKGSTTTNSISLDGGSEKASARASITHSKNEWIMPNTGYERISAAISMNFKVSDKLKLNSKFNYTNKKSDNLPATGYNNQSMSYFMIFQNPNVNLDWYKPRWKNGQYQINQIHPFSSFIDNPYLIANEMTNGVNTYKTVGSLSATYDLSNNLNLMVRSGIDMTNEDREQRRPWSTANFTKGYYKQQNIFNYEINSDALLSYKTKISSSFNFNASAGANTRSTKNTVVNGYVTGLIIPGDYKLSNGTSSPIMTTNYMNRKTNSVYGLANFSYQNSIFIDVTGRNDWSSTLPIQNNSFFYPSISSSFILSDLFKLPAEISFAKLRLSAAQVGNDTDPYKTSRYYSQSEFAASGSVATTLFNANFKPELTTSYEGGIEYNMFKGRLGLDLTLYNNFTKNQILEVPLDQTTGYSRAVLNSGLVRNQGIEVLLTGKPIHTKDFKWNITINWAKNKNKVLELADGMDNRQDIGYGGNATIQARVGGSTGGIYGFGFLRSPDVQVVYDKNGLTARTSEIQYIGEAFADWKGGINNEFVYKNFRFSFLIDGQYGGMIYSQTHHKMTEQGKLTHTLPGREEGFIIGNGVVLNVDGTYSPNTTKVAPGSYYADFYRRANVEANSFDASYLKLRELRIEFNIPKNWLNKIGLNQASIAVYGRDLAMITSFPMFDPETASLNGSTILPGVEMGQLPSPRTFGMNLTLKF
jgi:TonB-linked SusC/RagA family outer membrane protein